MNPQDFARRHFPDYKTTGDEIKPRFCPYCKGNGKDKYTFGLNVSKLTYNCKRGSCGVSGTFNQLCRDFGEESDRDSEYMPRRPAKVYITPQTNILPLSKQAEEYLIKRKISKETLTRRKVGSDDKGNIIFPYYEKDKLVMIKFRPAKKVEKGERKAWREEGGKPVLWGMEVCQVDKPLVITEGEIDALTLDEVGIPNAVSVPSGAEDLTWIENCWEFLEQFKEIILFGDNDEPGQEMIRKLIVKLGEHRCSIANHEHKDANELLFYKGPEAVKKAYEQAKEVPISGLLRLSEVKALNLDNIVAAHSGIGALDKVLKGFMMGQVSVWTGESAAGKSSFLGQMLIESINQGFGVCAFSGELPAALFKYWIDLQSAGPEYIKDGRIPDDIKRRISEWYKNQFFLYDSFGSVKSTDILKVFEYANKRYDCKVFVIDNLMMTDFSDGEKDWYHGQSQFIGKVKEFVHKHDVHCHVVAHPRKAEGKIEKRDVAGSGDITNRADNVLSIARVNDKDIKKNSALADCQTILSLLKGRFTGKQDIDIGLTFNEASKRFSPVGAPLKRYGWDNPFSNLGDEIKGVQGWIV